MFRDIYMENKNMKTKMRMKNADAIKWLLRMEERRKGFTGFETQNILFLMDKWSTDLRVPYIMI